VAFTAAIVQFAPDKGKVSKNLDRMAENILQAVAEGAELIVFPETAPTGYFLEGAVVELAMTGQKLAAEFAHRLSGKITRKISIVTGFYESLGGNLYNSAAYLDANSDGISIVKTYQKFFLPTYGVFDEERFVSRGKDLGLIETDWCTGALLICEDVWHSVLPTLCAVGGATMMIVPSASPARGFQGPTVENADRYERLVRGISEEHGTYVILAQLVGFEGGKGFVGGSLITDPFGQVLVKGPIGEEALLLATLDMDLVQIARAKTPLISDLQSAWSNIQSIVQRGFPEVS